MSDLPQPPDLRQSMFTNSKTLTSENEGKSNNGILTQKIEPNKLVQKNARPLRTLSQDAELFNIQTRDHTENIYQSCCGGTSDKRLIVLGAQIGLSTMVVVFSGAMLILHYDSESCGDGVYMSLLSSTLAFWFGRSNEDRR